MNNSSPFTPPSSVADQKNQSRARARKAVTLVFAANFVAMLALLIIGFGCRKPVEPDPIAPETNTMTMPEFDTNIVAQTQVSTNDPGTNVVAYVPPAPEPVAPVVAPSALEYVIVSGDTFEKIAKNHGVTTRAVQDANPGVDAKKLKIGQKITVPAPTAVVVAPADGSTVVAETAAVSEQVYKVKSGDTLTTIAKRHGVTVKAIRSANSLTTDKIKVGDKLKIPAAAAPAPKPL